MVREDRTAPGVAETSPKPERPNITTIKSGDLSDLTKKVLRGEVTAEEALANEELMGHLKTKWEERSTEANKLFTELSRLARAYKKEKKIKNIKWADIDDQEFKAILQKWQNLTGINRLFGSDRQVEAEEINTPPPAEPAAPLSPIDTTKTFITQEKVTSKVEPTVRQQPKAKKPKKVVPVSISKVIKQRIVVPAPEVAKPTQTPKVESGYTPSEKAWFKAGDRMNQPPKKTFSQLEQAWFERGDQTTKNSDQNSIGTFEAEEQAWFEQGEQLSSKRPEEGTPTNVQMKTVDAKKEIIDKNPDYKTRFENLKRKISELLALRKEVGQIKFGLFGFGKLESKFVGSISSDPNDYLVEGYDEGLLLNDSQNILDKLRKKNAVMAKKLENYLATVSTLQRQRSELGSPDRNVGELKLLGEDKTANAKLSPKRQKTSRFKSWARVAAATLGFTLGAGQVGQAVNTAHAEPPRSGKKGISAHEEPNLTIEDVVEITQKHGAETPTEITNDQINRIVQILVEGKELDGVDLQLYHLILANKFAQKKFLEKLQGSEMPEGYEYIKKALDSADTALAEARSRADEKPGQAGSESASKDITFRGEIEPFLSRPPKPAEDNELSTDGSLSSGLTNPWFRNDENLGAKEYVTIKPSTGGTMNFSPLPVTDSSVDGQTEPDEALAGSTPAEQVNDILPYGLVQPETSAQHPTEQSNVLVKATVERLSTILGKPVKGINIDPSKIPAEKLKQVIQILNVLENRLPVGTQKKGVELTLQKLREQSQTSSGNLALAEKPVTTQDNRQSADFGGFNPFRFRARWPVLEAKDYEDPLKRAVYDAYWKLQRTLGLPNGQAVDFSKITLPNDLIRQGKIIQALSLLNNSTNELLNTRPETNNKERELEVRLMLEVYERLQKQREAFKRLAGGENQIPTRDKGLPTEEGATDEGRTEVPPPSPVTEYSPHRESAETLIFRLKKKLGFEENSDFNLITENVDRIKLEDPEIIGLLGELRAKLNSDIVDLKSTDRYGSPDGLKKRGYLDTVEELLKTVRELLKRVR